MLLSVTASLSEDMPIKSTLPNTIKNMSEVIGLPAALALVDKFGGTEIRIPSRRDENSAGAYQRLVETIGDDAAHKLVKSYSGDEIYIPNCNKTRKVLRDIEMVRSYDALICEISSRQAIKSLAAEHHLSSRQVEKIVNAPTGN